MKPQKGLLYIIEDILDFWLPQQLLQPSIHSKHHQPPFKQDYFPFQLDFDSTANLIN